MSDLFVARDVSKTFGHGKNAVEAVRGVSFSLAENEVVTVVGESGSGKSTLARMVLGLTPVSSGSLTFRGTDVTTMGSRARTAYWKDVQAVFQDPFSAFNQFFTVRRLLARSSRLLDRAVGQERLAEALGHVGLDPADVLDRFPHELSGGQRQRVMIARALMMRPKLLIADEATSMLDASLRVNVLNVLTDLRDDLGMTVLFITHDIGQACYVADRVLVMEHGVLVEQGPAEDVIFAPQHPYTRRLLSDVPTLHEVARDVGPASPGPEQVGLEAVGVPPVRGEAEQDGPA
jgi:peptide/nickel transport system ATP-binding protein